HVSFQKIWPIFSFTPASHARRKFHELHTNHQSQIASQALDYSLKRWEALTRYLNDGDAPIDNNWVENQIRPVALGRKNWLFAGSLDACCISQTVKSVFGGWLPISSHSTQKNDRQNKRSFLHSWRMANFSTEPGHLFRNPTQDVSFKKVGQWPEGLPREVRKVFAENLAKCL